MGLNDLCYLVLQPENLPAGAFGLINPILQVHKRFKGDVLLPIMVQGRQLVLFL